MSDGGLRLYVDTQELSQESVGVLFGMRNKFGQFVFAEAEKDINVDEIEIPKYAKIEKKDKTPSERLHAVLFVYWKNHENLQKKYQDFNDFYRYKMNEIINHFKPKT